MLIFEKSYDNLINSLYIRNMTKYITINSKTSFTDVISRNYQQACNAV